MATPAYASLRMVTMVKKVLVTMSIYGEEQNLSKIGDVHGRLAETVPRYSD
ncbi:hypothetical protein MUP77_03555 [Candidatus Bathyarchaeota archaeon]|nr:hypothetical protein [Candidatus Bathyarchaeota archaeon]